MKTYLFTFVSTLDILCLWWIQSNIEKMIYVKMFDTFFFTVSCVGTLKLQRNILKSYNSNTLLYYEELHI